MRAAKQIKSKYGHGNSENQRKRRGGEKKVCVFHKNHKVKQTLKIYAVLFFKQYIIRA